MRRRHLVLGRIGRLLCVETARWRLRSGASTAAKASADNICWIAMPAAKADEVAEILRNQLNAAGQDKGAAVVMDPATGDLLASVSLPAPPQWDGSPGLSPAPSGPEAEQEQVERTQSGDFDDFVMKYQAGALGETLSEEETVLALSVE